MSSSNRVVQVDIASVTSVGAFDSESLEQIGAAALKDDGQVDTNKVQIIAWAVKSANDSVPPKLFEEVIALLKSQIKDAPSSHPKWTLAFVSRVPNSSGSLLRHWRLSVAAPPLVWRREYQSLPDESEIRRFIHSTNFGNNEIDDTKKLLQVIAYGVTHDFLNFLQTGIPRDEKRRRKEEYLQAIADPIDVP